MRLSQHSSVKILAFLPSFLLALFSMRKPSQISTMKREEREHFHIIPEKRLHTNIASPLPNSLYEILLTALPAWPG